MIHSSRRCYYILDDVGIPAAYSRGYELQYISHADKTVALYHQEVCYKVYLSQQPFKKQREQNNGSLCENQIF